MLRDMPKNIARLFIFLNLVPQISDLLCEPDSIWDNEKTNYSTDERKNSYSFHAAE